jgi:hypothetical protein
MRNYFMPQLVLLFFMACGCGFGFGIAKGESGYPFVYWVTETVAQDRLRDRRDMYAIFFCTEEEATTAGEGSKAINAYAVEKGKPLLTVFDSHNVVRTLKTASVTQFVKVPNSPGNAGIFQKFGSVPGTVILCRASGEIVMEFSGKECEREAIVEKLERYKKQEIPIKHDI